MKGSQIHFWAKMGLGKFGWGINGTRQIWVGANMGLGLDKFGSVQIWVSGKLGWANLVRANLAGQTWPGQKWLDTEKIAVTTFWLKSTCLF